MYLMYLFNELIFLFKTHKQHDDWDSKHQESPEQDNIVILDHRGFQGSGVRREQGGHNQRLPRSNWRVKLKIDDGIIGCKLK